MAWILLVLTQMTVVSLLHLPPHSDWHVTGFAPSDDLGQFDAVWYSRIAENGYSFSIDGASAFAFFPGYPLLIRVVTLATGLPYGVSGSLIACVFGLLCIVAFNRLANRLLDPKTATYSTVAFMAYPYSMFFFGPAYSEGLAITLVLTAFLMVERDRLWLAGIAAAGAAFSRPIALGLVIGLTARAWECNRTRGGTAALRSAMLIAALTAVGQIAYMAFCMIRVGDPLAFLHAETYYGWQGDSTIVERMLKIPYFQLLGSLSDGLEAPFKPITFQTLGLLAGIACILLIAFVPKILPKSYLFFSIACLITPTVGTSNFGSWGRYVILAFPMFMVLGYFGTRPVLRRVWLAVAGGCVAMQLVFAILFSRGWFLS